MKKEIFNIIDNLHSLRVYDKSKKKILADKEAKEFIKKKLAEVRNLKVVNNKNVN